MNSSINERLLKRSVPDFFVKNGKAVSTAAEWEQYRSELRELFLNRQYGIHPPRLIPKIKAEPQWVDFAGKAKWESVYFTFQNNGKEHTVRTELILPKAANERQKTPVFLYISFSPDIPNKYLPVEEIIDNGFGIFTFYYENVTTDNGDFSNGLCALFSDENGECGFGKISLWSYMASICMDYLCSLDNVDNDSIAVIGHSRLGKTALLTSALDERFLLTCANNSGCCGAALSRGKTDGNETLREITKTFPFWFCKEYFKYVDNEAALPFDQHMLLALIAPRYLMIGGAREDVWADNEGQLLSCHLASYAWRLYDKDGLILVTGNEHLKGEVCFHLRDGTHFLSRYDWGIYMKKFKEIIEKNEAQR